jgi:hypothetical protein
MNEDPKPGSVEEMRKWIDVVDQGMKRPPSNAREVPPPTQASEQPPSVEPKLPE